MFCCNNGMNCRCSDAMSAELKIKFRPQTACVSWSILARESYYPLVIELRICRNAKKSFAKDAKADSEKEAPKPAKKGAKRAAKRTKKAEWNPAAMISTRSWLEAVWGFMHLGRSVSSGNSLDHVFSRHVPACCQGENAKGSEQVVWSWFQGAWMAHLAIAASASWVLLTYLHLARQVLTAWFVSWSATLPRAPWPQTHPPRIAFGGAAQTAKGLHVIDKRVTSPIITKCGLRGRVRDPHWGPMHVINWDCSSSCGGDGWDCCAL